jgi:hypothetical protein
VSHAALSSSGGPEGRLPPKPQVLGRILKLLQDAPWGSIYITAPALDLLQMALQAVKDRGLSSSQFTSKDIFELFVLELLASCGMPLSSCLWVCQRSMCISGHCCYSPGSC